ncbi:MAG: DUF1353 domain-containing protein [Kiritimatiellae bacterium]|nr:DUF1353 domain-containing protein [Kiritimatiellia bacterium]
MAVKTEIIGDTTFWNGVPMPHVTPGVVAGEWRLTRTFHFEGVLPDGRVFEIWIREGFTFDGASIPRSLWRVCGAPMEIPRIVAAMIHDWLYRSQLVERELADEIYNCVCKLVGMGSWRTGPEWAALRAFGGSAWKENRKEWAKVSAARELGSLVLEGEEIK